MHDTIGRGVLDKITGFRGIVTGRVEYITGCNQLLVQPRVKDGSNDLAESRWIDEQRCTVDPGQRIELDNGASPGPDRPAPRR